jgi:allantoinase
VPPARPLVVEGNTSVEKIVSEMNQPFEHSAINARPRLEMPGGARVALWVCPAVEYFDFDEPVRNTRFEWVEPQSPSAHGWYTYGMRVGIYRLMDVLSRHGVRGSVVLNSDVCEAYPDIIKAGNDLDWVWLAHGKRNRIYQHKAFSSREEEKVYLEEMLATHSAATGTHPKGWVGPGLSESEHTLELLVELGLTYVGDWGPADDQPFDLKVPNGRMICMPYPIDGLNDAYLPAIGSTGEDHYRMIVDQFDQLYAEGAMQPRVMCIVAHAHVSGQPFRARALDRALQHITSHDDVWLTTSDEIASWYLSSY